MPDNATKVADWLKARKGKAFCNRCVGKGSSIEPVNQVNQLVRPLGNTKEYAYKEATCSECGLERKCVAYIG
jgi:hypothetical protein